MRRPVPLGAFVRARRLSGRALAMGVVALFGAVTARVPAPTLRVDLESAGYPAVVVGAVVPVLVGALGVVPAGERLTWLLADGGRRGRSLRVADLTVVAAAAAGWAAVAGAPAGLAAAAVQNALVTLGAAAILGRLVGAAAAAVAVVAGAVVGLLTVGAPGAGWIPIDAVSDAGDWVVVGVLAAAALATTARPVTAAGNVRRW